MSQPQLVDRDVLVLGGTSEAGDVARELAGIGYSVWRLGLVGFPAVSSPSDVQTPPYSNASLLTFEGQVGSFHATFMQDGDLLPLQVSALVVAVGNERYFPAERYGLSLSANVLTASQLLERLEASPQPALAALRREQRVVFCLDRGGETAKETATEALRAAVQVRRLWGSEVYVLYENLKVDTLGLERLTREMRQSGIVFCWYDEANFIVGDDGITVAYEEGEIRGGLLILPEAVRPHPQTQVLADILNVRVGDDGYFQDVNIRQYRPGMSSRRGVFFAGYCHIDCIQQEAHGDALQAAANVDALLGSGALQPDEFAAHVDSTKCIRCLTCVRTCPHAAVEIAEYEDVMAARVMELACQACGACVTNCPVQAIERVGAVAPVWMQSA